MPTRNQPVSIVIDGEVYELDAATTQGVTLVHRVTQERRTLTYAELANIVPSEEQRSPRLLDHVPGHVVHAADIMAMDIDEVLTGVGRNGKSRPEYDPATTSQEQRITRKLTELEWAGRGMARSTFFAKLKKYQRDGIVGLIDGRAIRDYIPNERVEVVVINHLNRVIDKQKDWSTGTVKRIIEQTIASVETVHLDVKFPSRSTWYALVKQLGEGKHATGSRKTRASLANRPTDRAMAKSEPLLPGAQVEIDTNTMDIEVQTPKGGRKRVRLSLMLDVYSRTIMAYTFRLEGTKGVDHTMLLAQAITPHGNRPDRTVYRQLLRRKHPQLSLLPDNEYERHAAERPYIFPTNITVDRGSDYISPVFRNAAEQRGCNVLLSAPYTPTSKPHIERMFHTINTMFVQHLDGYIGRSPEHRGKTVPLEKLLTLEALRELFEDWVISVWQNRPHSSLRDPLHPTRYVSPNQKASRAALTVAQLRMPLTTVDYIHMLESKFRAILPTGIKVNKREYDADELNPLRGTRSHMPRHKGKWEVKVDPYNTEAVWVIGTEGELIECRERGAADRQYEPDFAPVEDYRALTAQADAELAGTPYPQAVHPAPLPTHTVIEDDVDDEDFLPHLLKRNIMLAFTSHDSDITALNRRESLLHYLQHPLTPPAAGENVKPNDRYAYDQQRMDYLSGGIVLRTTTVAQGQLLLTRAFQENRSRNSGHAGVILSGDSTLGKTTTAKRLMRWVLEQYTAQVPEWEQFEHIPVMYVEVPSGSNAKGLLREFCDFFGLSVLSRDSTADLRTKVVAAIRRARTQLIVVDELHNLSGRASGLGEAVDLLKGLHNDVSATFLYCGLDVTNSTLMHGPRGQQLKSRFSVVELERYQWSNAAHRKEWKMLIRGFEQELQLRDHPVGTFNPLVEYLYQRTGGSIGSLGRLLTGTAIDLIQNGAKVERLDRDQLDGYTLDLTAETFYRTAQARSATKSKTAIERVMS